MKIIILRGLPGCGKTEISKKIGNILDCKKIIHVDKFKLEIMEKSPNLKFEEVLKQAYNQTLQELKKSQNTKIDLVIIEELFNDEIFIKQVIKLCETNQIHATWIYIKRNIDEILKTESSRNRKIKNSYQDLQKLEKEIENNKIQSEIIVENNDSLEKVTNEIIAKI